MPRSNSEKEKNGFTVVLEAIHSDIRALAEKFDFVDRRLEEMERRVGAMEGRFDGVDAELFKIGISIAEVKTLLSRKADLSRLAAQEVRLKNLENVVKQKK